MVEGYQYTAASTEESGMTPFIRGVVDATVATFALPGPVVEIGAYQVEGQGELIDLRGLFPGKSYLGVDMRAGPGVDRVEDVEGMTFETESVGTVLALSTFEHVRRFWVGVEEVKRVVRRDGVVMIAVPFAFHIHNHPSDYWRFTPEALDSLLENRFPQRILGQQGPAKRPVMTWVVAFGAEYPRVGQEQVGAYREAIRQLARSPHDLGRALRYRIGRWLCGKGPFRAHFDQDRFDVELRQGVASSIAA